MAGIRGFVKGLRRKQSGFAGNIQNAAASVEERAKEIQKAHDKQLAAHMKMQAFEHEVARKTGLVEERRALKAASEKLQQIIGLEVSPNHAKMLSAFLVENLGHEVIEQLHAQGQLKKFLVQSPALKAAIMSLKSGQRVQRNLFEGAAHELGEMLKEMQGQ